MGGEKFFLSKSNYVKGLQCQKALWFFNYRKDLKPALDDKTEAKFETGNEITELARKYFMGGIKAADDYFDIKNAAASTKDLIEATSKNPTHTQKNRVNNFFKNLYSRLSNL